MKVVLQRVKSASVEVEGELVSRIGAGLLLLVGVGDGDSSEEAAWLADKVANLRVFEDGDGKMNRSVLDSSGEILAVSQFTLLGDASRGRRPSFIKAARPEVAEPIFDHFRAGLEAAGVGSVKSGVFGAMMDVSLVNDGPVTLLLERS